MLASKPINTKGSYMNTLAFPFMFIIFYFLGGRVELVPETSPNEWDLPLHTQLHIILFRIEESKAIEACTVHFGLFFITFTEHLFNVCF